ncbi:MAG: hypothetical protein ACN6NI_03770, partial [Acinetobacter sp.]
MIASNPHHHGEVGATARRHLKAQSATTHAHNFYQDNIQTTIFVARRVSTLGKDHFFQRVTQETGFKGGQ